MSTQTMTTENPAVGSAPGPGVRFTATREQIADLVAAAGVGKSGRVSPWVNQVQLRVQPVRKALTNGRMFGPVELRQAEAEGTIAISVDATNSYLLVRRSLIVKQPGWRRRLEGTLSAALFVSTLKPQMKPVRYPHTHGCDVTVTAEALQVAFDGNTQSFKLAAGAAGFNADVHFDALRAAHAGTFTALAPTSRISLMGSRLAELVAGAGATTATKRSKLRLNFESYAQVDRDADSEQDDDGQYDDGLLRVSTEAGYRLYAHCFTRYPDNVVSVFEAVCAPVVSS